MPEDEAETIHALALGASIADIRKTLSDAVEYLEAKRHLAALGTLVMFEEQAEDVKAAIRLFRRSIQTDRRRGQ